MRTCVIEGCSNTFHGRGMCRSHYMEWWRGDRDLPRYEPPAPLSMSERFWQKVDVRGDDDCWLWQASILPNGYGQFDHSTAHRRSYEIAHPGEDIAGKHIDHTCRRLDCVNPKHLEAVLPSVNHRRGYAVNIMASLRKEQARTATHCRNGHERTPETTYITPDGYRVCRTCKANSTKKKRKKR